MADEDERMTEIESAPATHDLVREYMMLAYNVQPQDLELAFDHAEGFHILATGINYGSYVYSIADKLAARFNFKPRRDV